MAEPNGSKLPASYDDITTLLGNLEDHRTLTMGQAIGSTETSFTVLGTFGFELPCYFFFTDGTDEIIYVESMTVEVSGIQATFTSVVRGARGTTAQAHLGTAILVSTLSGKHMTQFRDALLSAEKYQALVVTSLPSAPLPGEVAVYGGDVYFCVSAGAWQLVSRPSHTQLTNLAAGDPHTNLHNDARASTWHNSLSGGHVYDGDSHDHSKGAGIARFKSGLEAYLATPAAAGEVYYGTDSKILRVATAAGSWQVITGAPIGAIALFDEAAVASYGGGCPPGWSRFTALDGAFPIGADAAHTTQASLVALGADSHAHTYSQVAAHTHTVPQVTISTDTSATHKHSYANAGGYSGDAAYDANQVNLAYANTGSAGSHTHTVTFALHNTASTLRTSDNAAGVASATSSAIDKKPPYKTFVFCTKD